MTTDEGGPLLIKRRNSEGAQEKLQTAFVCHQRGDLVTAKRLYDEILIENPRHFDALHLSGLLACQASDFSNAGKLFDRAVMINGNFAPLYLNRGNALHKQNRFEDALVSYDQAIAIKPDYADAYNNRGNTLKDLSRYDEAFASYEKTLLIVPDHVQAFNSSGVTLAALKRFEVAVQSYDQAICLNLHHADFHNNRGVALQALKRLREALVAYDNAIILKPETSDFYNNRGVALQAMGRCEAALSHYGKALTIKPDDAEARHNRGDSLRELERLDEAIVSYDEAIAIMSDHVRALNNRGLALQDMNRLEEALASYATAIAVDPNYAEPYLNRGVIQNNLLRLDQAIFSYEQALQKRPDYPEAYFNRANTLKKLKRYDDALTSFDHAIRLRPDYADACYNRGLTLMEMKRFDEALMSLDSTLMIAPDYLDAYNSRANVLAELERFDEATGSFDKAFLIKKDYAEAYSNRGVMLNDLARFEEAIRDYDRALSLEPDLEFIEGNVFSSRMKICDWSNHDDVLRAVLRRLERRQRAFHPFYVLGAVDDCGVQKVAAEVWSESRHLASINVPKSEKYQKDRKIRIGYFSPDFGNHPVSYLTAQMFELHDRSKFEVVGFYFGAAVNNDMHARIRAAFDAFHEVRSLSGYKIAELARLHEIDVAVDLCGYTLYSRPEIFAHRAAPIQISYLGFPGTMGAKFIDYVIADQILIPPDKAHSYAEKMIYLPCFQVNDAKRRISGRSMTRGEFGLPNEAFIFCCFNNTYKFNPATFDVWAQILGAVAQGVLWIFADTPSAQSNITAEFANRSIPAQRLVFAEKVVREEYLARYRLADLFLDTLPYNGGTTVSDALWAGLPVLTQQGESFAGRMAASLLSALGLNELIAGSARNYVRMAIELASDEQKLAAIRAKLASNIGTSIVFDSVRSTRCIEAGYSAAHERHHADQGPDHIYIDG